MHIARAVEYPQKGVLLCGLQSERSSVAPPVISPAVTDRDLAAVRQLCWDYRDFLTTLPGISAKVTDSFNPAARYAALMEHLPTLHARPHGIILLARNENGTPVGCGMSHPLDEETSEIKRVFVTPEARGTGAAHQLCEALIAQARHDNFARVVLDTHRLLHAAQRLYLRLGFTPRGPYQPTPDDALDELLFFEKPLCTAPETR